jgi:hypothetical protein
MPNQQHQNLSADEIEVRIWGFVVIMVTLILAVIVVALLYSVTFVTQPIKSMAPIDQAYTKMLNDIVLLIVGGIGGVMSKRATKAVSQAIAEPSGAPPGPKPSAHSVMPEFNWMGYKNPELDETWVAPPPPTTPANYIDPAMEDIAQERAAARSET